MPKTNILCSFCKKIIQKWPFEIKEFKNLFCGKKCHDKFQTTKPILKCKYCGGLTNKFRKLCDNCLPAFKKELALKIASKGGQVRWKGHKSSYNANGYIMEKVPTHPLANKKGYVYKHRLIMEKKLGRYLSKIEVVHHKDGNKLNNKISNLVIFKTTGDHTTYHLFNGDVGKKTLGRKNDAIQFLRSNTI